MIKQKEKIMATKIFQITIDGKQFLAQYIKKQGWVIEVPTGVWYFDDTVPMMKREVLSVYPSATFTQIK